jgi:predicted DCC family thiol-disulfide oxidoreductase YuxK
MMKQRIILFDGICNFCNDSVNFIIRHDPAKKFRFASLQSAAGQSLLHSAKLPRNLHTIILLEEDQWYDQSTAILRICKELTGFWKVGYLFIVVPKSVRNLVYRRVANNRYKLFGKRASCMIPTKEVKERFILD